MYFASHQGKYIRLAYADSVDGPWKIYENGTLTLEQASAFHGHIASPDVQVDNKGQEIRMYFHGPEGSLGTQVSGFAVSKDGINFNASKVILGNSYLHVFSWKGAYYGIAKEGHTGWGELLHSPDGITPFQSRGNLIKDMRHPAVMIRGGYLIIFYTRVGDSPERIFASTVALDDDWTKWTASEPVDILKPEKDYEGIEYPKRKSHIGPEINVQQLRDPCIFEENGHIYLFYSIAGETGIAMAEITLTLEELPKKAG